MRTYFERDGIVIYHADCREVLPNLPSASFGLVVTSPPYNVGLSPGGNGRGFYTPSRGGRSATKWHDFNGYGTHDDAMPLDDYVAWQQDTLRSLWDLIGDKGAIFYNHKPRIVFKNIWLPLVLNPQLPLRQIIIWDRGGGIAMGDGHYCPGYEWIMLFTKPAFRLRCRADSGIGDVWRIPFESDRNGHPAPFPVALPHRAITTTGARRVLDPFMGTGSTLVAAAMEGADAVGIEISEEYCEIAANRLRQAVLPFAADPPPTQLALEASG